jgi:sugar lactone lactonase YvrE
MDYPHFEPGEVRKVAVGVNGSEGVVIDREGVVYGGGADGCIRKLTPDGELIEVANTGGRPAGLALDREGTLFVCDVAMAAVLKITQAGKVSSFAERAGDVELCVPNFLVFDEDGYLYVSNSFDHRLQPGTDPLAEPPSGSVVRFDRSGNGEVVARGISVANGLAIDPAESALYCLASGTRNLYRIEKRGDGTHGPPEPFVEDFGQVPDGVAFDGDGFLIVTMPVANQLLAVDPDGDFEVILSDPNETIVSHPTNCAFGGENFDELYVALHHENHMAWIPLGRRGHALYERR